MFEAYYSQLNTPCLVVDEPMTRELLESQLADPPSLEALAAAVNLSPFHFARVFRQATGLPPHAWLLQQRAERARHLVLRGASLASAAADCGFADQSHMTRIFARQFGFTPGAWQKATAGRQHRPVPQ